MNFANLLEKFSCDKGPIEPISCPKCDFSTHFLRCFNQHVNSSCKNQPRGKSFRVYKCDRCPYQTHSFLIWMKHKRSYCLRNGSYVSESLSSLYRKEKIAGVMWYDCVFCKYRSRFSSSVSRHAQAKHMAVCDKKWLQCDYCSFRTLYIYNLKEHARKTHFADGYIEKVEWSQCLYSKKCTKCQYFAKSVFSITNHLKRHNLCQELFNCEQDSVEAFFCTKCRFTTHLVTGYNHHINECHQKKAKNEFTIKKSKCPICPFETYSSLILLRHRNKGRHLKIENLTNQRTLLKKEKKWLECDHCAFKTQHPRSLKFHINAKHTAPDRAQWFQCDHCAFKTLHKHILRRHVGRFHTEHTKWLHCHQCAYKSYYAIELRKHVHLKHTLQLLKCQKCHFKTEIEEMLRHHVNNSHAPKFYQCSFCEYKNKRRDHLNMHINNRHTPIDEVVWLNCDQCNYKSKQKSTLKRHMLVHTPFACVKCQFCTFRTKDQCLLNRHIKRRHPVECVK